MTGDELRKHREKLGLSQAQLSIKLGYSPSAVHLYESGKRDIPEKFIVAFDMFKMLTAAYATRGFSWKMLGRWLARLGGVGQSQD